MSELTIEDLVSMEQMACTVLAGSGGLTRRLVWAHSCELDDPWNWLGVDELLMTVGICLPRNAPDQVDFIRNLHKAGVAGVAIGDDLKAPPLTPQMLEESNRLNFPVFTVGHTTPFAALARTVAIASQSEQISRIARLSRLYELARTATAGAGSLLSRLSSELGHRLHVLDVEYQSEILRSDGPLSEKLTSSLCELVSARLDRLPPRIKVTEDTQVLATALALTTHRKCMLVVPGPAEVDVDAFVLLHLQSLVAMEVEKLTREREQSDASGKELLGQIIAGSLGADAAHLGLEKAGLTLGPWRVLGFDVDYLYAARVLLGDRHISNLSCEKGDYAFLLLSEMDREEAVAALKTHVTAIGISASTSAAQNLADSTRQARWALQAAHAAGGGMADYTTAAPLFLPRTLADAQLAARSVLGPLIDHDINRELSLIETLEAFLSTDRSWTATAEKLLIHRQSLGYRLRKIEALTGRSLKSTSDIAQLWMALVAWRITREGE